MTTPDSGDYAGRLGTDFDWQLPDGRTLPLRLLDCRVTGAAGTTSSFVLTFKASSDAPKEQATYLLSADGFAPRSMLLVPVQQLPDGLLYEAVFTHLPG